MKKEPIIAILILLIVTLVFYNYNNEPSWSLTEDGLIKYPTHRGKLEYTRTLIEDNGSYTVDKVVYKSRGKDIYGLLFRPKLEGKVPVVVGLPAARARKEQHRAIAELILSQGIAYFVIDQRGIGETSGPIPPGLHDYNQFLANKEPFQHLMIYDALRAFDFVYNQKDLDKNNIVFFGSSMGGRTAIIASAMEPKSKGAIVFSTAGYVPKPGSIGKFIYSFNPNNYVGNISPRKLVMFHSKNDTVIPIKDAEVTFELAKQPKKFIVMDSRCNHGFCFYNKDEFVKELKSFFN
ncbi:alpha/beta fold hydrolase [Candidatus Woesearchaeota archaeon]|nr:MAG: alpha/beta fold hydrolase [Candidatus Woesearchaeota archaeon]